MLNLNFDNNEGGTGAAMRCSNDVTAATSDERVDSDLGKGEGDNDEEGAVGAPQIDAAAPAVHKASKTSIGVLSLRARGEGEGKKNNSQRAMITSFSRMLGAQPTCSTHAWINVGCVRIRVHWVSSIMVVVCVRHHLEF